MRRRFQFSLRTLLCLTVVVCVGLGARHRWQQAAYVECEPAGPHEPVRATGLFTRMAGVQHEIYWLTVALEKPSASFYWTFDKGAAPREWIGIYRFETMIGPFHEPGDYTVKLFTEDGVRFSGTMTIK